SAVLKGKDACSVWPRRTTDKRAGVRLSSKSEVGWPFQQVECDRIVANRVCRVKRLVRVFVDAGAVVKQRHRERVCHATAQGHATLAAKLGNVDPSDLEGIDAGKSERLDREVAKGCSPRGRVQVRPRRSNSRRSSSELGHRRRVVVVTRAKRDVAVRIPEESVPHTASRADRPAKHKLEAAAQRSKQR